MGVGCARAGGRWEHRKSSVDVLLETQGGVELCVHGGVAARDDNPTGSLVPRVSLGHMITSCKHVPRGHHNVGVRGGTGCVW